MIPNTMNVLENLLSVVHVLVALLLVTVILLQQGKGGGPAGFGGASATQVFGGRGAGNLLSKLTWIFACVFVVTSVVLGGLPRWRDRAFQSKVSKTHAERKSAKDAAKPTPPAAADVPMLPGAPGAPAALPATPKP